MKLKFVQFTYADSKRRGQLCQVRWDRTGKDGHVKIIYVPSPPPRADFEECWRRGPFNGYRIANQTVPVVWVWTYKGKEYVHKGPDRTITWMAGSGWIVGHRTNTADGGKEIEGLPSFDDSPQTKI